MPPLVGRRTYRIGFQQPWTNRAENQGFMSMRIAARRCGHELVAVNTSTEILRENLDFILCVASIQGKTTHLPTFANIHEPRTRWWEDEFKFHNLLTYDGYLTISNTLVEFLRSFAAGFGRRQEIGFYFNTPQRQRIRAHVEQLAATGALSLCYFGTNWEPRTRPLFRALSRRSYARIYGPPEAWAYLNGEGYCGSPPFDGISAQMTYARYGAGLVSLSKDHLLDDIISNRIFEITSVGAVAICPDIPWIRQNFGESVYYYDPHQRFEQVSDQIHQIVGQVYERPQEAAERARTAAEIFEERFSADVLFPNVVQYYEDWEDCQRTRIKRSEAPLIDVIIRVGGRTVDDYVLTAVRSVDAQTHGNFRIIFVRWRQLDLVPVLDADWQRITEFKIVDCIGGRRATTMCAGLQHVDSEYFCILDDDDFWLPEHIESLLRVIEELPANNALAYSGIINQVPTPVGQDNNFETRRIVNLSPAVCGRVNGQPTEGTVWDVTGSFAPNNWLASKKLLNGLCLDDWTLATAEDTVLIGHLLQKAEVGFSWRATAVQVVGTEGSSNFQATETRESDLLECMLRIGRGLNVIERKFMTPRATVWERLGSQVQQLFREKGEKARPPGGVLVLQEGMVGTSIHERDVLEKRELPLTPQRLELHGRGSFQESESGEKIISVLPPPSPWHYGLVMKVHEADLLSGPHYAVFEFDGLPGRFGVGVLDSSGTEFLSRIETPSVSTPVELWVPIPTPKEATAIVIQNWDNANTSPARLRKIWVVAADN